VPDRSLIGLATSMDPWLETLGHTTVALHMCCMIKIDVIKSSFCGCCSTYMEWTA